MTKRQNRIAQNEILSELQNIPVQPVSIILRNGMVYYTLITKITETSLNIGKGSNRKEVEIKDIDEIIIDI